MAATLASCGDARERAPERAALGGEVVARVGDASIPKELVARVATAKNVSPRDALALLVDDAVAAEAAKARGLDRAPEMRWPMVTLRARAAAERMIADARAAGPPTQAELSDLEAKRWRELDLPEQVRVIHAVILRPQPPLPDALARAKDMANELHRQLATAPTIEDFRERARAFPHGDLKERVETLPPFVPDGRTTDGGDSRMDDVFTAAAFALKNPGDTTGVVETVFGWHVIRLIERLPPHRVPPAERREILEPAVYEARAAKARADLVESARAAGRVGISEAADRLTAEITRNAP